MERGFYTQKSFGSKTSGYYAYYTLVKAECAIDLLANSPKTGRNRVQIIYFC